jgi:hypothetical protein
MGLAELVAFFVRSALSEKAPELNDAGAVAPIPQNQFSKPMFKADGLAQYSLLEPC